MPRHIIVADFLRNRYNRPLLCAPVAQLDRATASGAVCRTFESSRGYSLVFLPHSIAPLFKQANVVDSLMYRHGIGVIC